MPSVLCACGHRVTTTPANSGRKGVCPRCRTPVSFPPADYAPAREFEKAPRRASFPDLEEALDGTDPELEVPLYATGGVRRALIHEEAGPLEPEVVDPAGTSREEPWSLRAAEVA